MGTGPLAGVRIIELQGIGPGPFCGMMLSDMGAEVIRVDQVQAECQRQPDFGTDHGGPLDSPHSGVYQ